MYRKLKAQTSRKTHKDQNERYRIMFESSFRNYRLTDSKLKLIRRVFRWTPITGGVFLAAAFALVDTYLLSDDK